MQFYLFVSLKLLLLLNLIFDQSIGQEQRAYERQTLMHKYINKKVKTQLK
jgi:hypothetical protein